MRNIKRDIKWEWVLSYMNDLGYDLIVPKDLRDKQKNPDWYCFNDNDFVFTKDGKKEWVIERYKDLNGEYVDGQTIKKIMDDGYSYWTIRTVYSMRQFKNDIYS